MEGLTMHASHHHCKGKWAAGKESLGSNWSSPCHQVLRASPFPPRRVLAKSAEVFCCNHGEVISLLSIVGKNGNVKRELFISICLTTCHFSTTGWNSPRGPKPSLILYFSFLYLYIYIFILYLYVSYFCYLPYLLTCFLWWKTFKCLLMYSSVQEKFLMLK